MGSLLYALVRVLLDVIATSHGDQAKLVGVGFRKSIEFDPGRGERPLSSATG